MSLQDPDKSRVYSAEDQLAHWLSRSSPVVLDGETFTPELEPRFTTPQQVQPYVDKVLAHLQGAERSYDGRERLPIRVRARAGHAKAHYEEGVIAIPSRERGGAWALRGLVVLHEIAHHLGGLEHGQQFRSTLIRLLEDLGNPETARLLHTAYAAEGLDATPATLADTTLAKIAKVLKQAERAPGEHERAAFLAKAQSLATRNSVALAVARAHTAQQEARESPVSESVTIGRPRQRGLARYARLLLNIAAANDLRATLTHDSTTVFLHGYAADVALTRLLYESLLVQMVADCETYLASRAVPGVDHPADLEVRVEWESGTPGIGAWVEKPVSKITARLAFYESYAARIGQRLATARDQATAKVKAESPTISQETALALRDKELEVHSYFDEVVVRDNVRGHWRGERSSAAEKAPASAHAGRRAANRAVLGGEQAITA